MPFQLKTRNIESNPIVAIQEGSPLTGFLINPGRNIQTKAGTSLIADFLLTEPIAAKAWDQDANERIDVTFAPGDKVSLFVTAGLIGLIEGSDVGVLHRISYQGLQKNPKTGRTFHAYTVEVDHDQVMEDSTPF